MRETLLRFEHPGGLRFQPTDVPNELVAERRVDARQRAVHLALTAARHPALDRLVIDGDPRDGGVVGAS